MKIKRVAKVFPTLELSPVKPSIYKSEVEVVKEIEDEETGLIFKKVEVEKKDIRDNFKGLKFTDFSLEKIVRAGAVDTLNNVSMSASKLSQVDSIGVSANSIEIPVQEENISEVE